KSICTPFGIDQEGLFADLDWDSILDKTAENHRLSLKEVSKYPSIRRDFALLIDKTVNFSQIEEIAYTSEKKLLKNVGLFDVYQGKNLPENKKSYAVSFTFLDDKKTLTDKKVDKIMEKLRKRLESQLDAELR